MHCLLSMLLALPAVLASATIDRRQTPDTIPDAWIVTLKSDVALPKFFSSAGALDNIHIGRSFDSAAFKGFSFSGKDNGQLEMLASMGAVESIRPDQKVFINAPTVHVQGRGRYVAESDAPWGLVRICRRKNNPAATRYIYDSFAQGSGVTAYVLDTGINLDHEEFGGRAVSGYNSINSSLSAEDDNGHGTHVSGTIGGVRSGVAKKVNLVAVKVLDAQGSGAVSGILAGIDWVVNDAKSKKYKAVANLSLGSGYYDLLNQAVANAVKAGVFFAVAAGNQGADAADYSPGSTPEACTIAASDQNDMKADFSNFGSVVDLFAPGVDIVSAWIGSSNAYARASGTSMASPHAAGVAAFLLSKPATKADSTKLCALMQKQSTKNVITSAGAGTTANLLNNPRPGQK